MNRMNFKVMLAAGLLLTICQSAASASAQEIIIDPGFSFSDIVGREFWFSSGAGGWATVLYVDEDGSFDGQFHDSEMGSTGEGYEYGSMYLCDFYGEFSEPEYIDEYTYAVRIKNMEINETPGAEEIINNIRYIYSTPYGLEDADVLYFYMPGAPLDTLPEEYLSWVHYDLYNTDEKVLPFYGLYNENAQTGFSSYLLEQDGGIGEIIADGEYSIDEELEDLEEQAEEMVWYANENLYTQQDLNKHAFELYTLWDDELNSIWARIKAILDEDTMAQITQEELRWIDEKETAIKEAGKEAEGGSMQPMLEYLEGAELTKQRVYVLAEYLR